MATRSYPFLMVPIGIILAAAFSTYGWSESPVSQKWVEAAQTPAHIDPAPAAPSTPAILPVLPNSSVGPSAPPALQPALPLEPQKAPGISTVPPSPTTYPLDASAANFDEGSKVSNAERLAIKVQGYPDLSGEYRISPDATISIPVIGRVPIGAADTTALEKVLADRVAQVTGRQAFVTVEIAQYRPVFVTGFVTTSGSVPWRPGMMVLHAIAMSGGTFRAGGDKNSPLNGDVEATRVQRATDDLKRVLAALARLKSEQAGSNTIEVPPRLTELATPEDVEKLIEAQRSSFASRKAALESQVATLKRGVASGEQELAGLEEQGLRLKEQLKLRRELKVKIDDMFKRGIVRAERQLEELSKIADLEEKATNVSVAVTRVQSSLVQLRRELQTLEQDRKAAVDTELLKLERDAAQLEIEISSARSAYGKITGSMPSATVTAELNAKMTIEYQIVRNGEHGNAPTVADQLSILRPGDIVVVTAK